MTNRILQIDIRDRSVIPTEAEVHVTVVPEFVDGNTEVTGRLMGPRCRFASTVEVAYHLRRMLMPTSTPAFTLKAIIPEASLWEPETPHLYTGPIELWQDGVRCEVAPVRHGLRQISLGPRGLRLNGRPIRLRGHTVPSCTDAEAMTLRQEGCNLLVVSVSEESRHIWEMADRMGFFVLGQVSSREQIALARPLTAHPCCLGWIASSEEMNLEELPSAVLLGTEPGCPMPEQVNFLAVRASEVAGMEAGLPVLLLGSEEMPSSEGGPVVLGTCS